MRGRLGRFALVLALATCLGSVGSGCAGSTGSVGTTSDRQVVRPLEMELRTPAGDWIHLADLRGRPVLLFLFATWDGVCQASLRPLSRFARNYPDVTVIGIAAQPDAAMLLDPYERALAPPFSLTYDPERRVQEGTSVLGPVEAVPTFLMLDAYGVEVERHVGFPNTQTLPRMRTKAIRRGGIGETDEQPSLLGTTPR